MRCQVKPTLFACVLAVLLSAATAGAQTTDAPHSLDAPSSQAAQPSASPAEFRNSSLGREFSHGILLRLPGDQRAIWTSPFRLNRRNARFWIPAAAVTAAVVLADVRLFKDSTERISPGAQANLGRFSNFGHPAYMVGTAGSLWLLGRASSHPRLQQTGLLAVRALLDDMAVVGALKMALGRERPPGGDFGGPPDSVHSGKFRSLPSGHSSAIWTLATVISSRHHERWVAPLLYGFAVAVGVTRVTSGHHFYGDVIAGSLIGYGVGRMVVRSANDKP
jgi:membrane-associated phospholipid phosphatase